ncbi:hypothetical protein EC988_005908 [Linderina pennispora]|nr:hypothetical protein EC988_005908 [Linderina pennispora]
MVSLPLEIAELVCQAADRPVLETLGQADHTWRQLALRELWHTVEISEWAHKTTAATIHAQYGQYVQTIEYKRQHSRSMSNSQDRRRSSDVKSKTEILCDWISQPWPLVHRVAIGGWPPYNVRRVQMAMARGCPGLRVAVLEGASAAWAETLRMALLWHPELKELHVTEDQRALLPPAADTVGRPASTGGSASLYGAGPSALTHLTAPCLADAVAQLLAQLPRVLPMLQSLDLRQIDAGVASRLHISLPPGILHLKASGHHPLSARMFHPVIRSLKTLVVRGVRSEEAACREHEHFWTPLFQHPWGRLERLVVPVARPGLGPMVSSQCPALLDLQVLQAGSIIDFQRNDQWVGCLTQMPRLRRLDIASSNNEYEGCCLSSHLVEGFKWQPQYLHTLYLSRLCLSLTALERLLGMLPYLHTLWFSFDATDVLDQQPCRGGAGSAAAQTSKTRIQYLIIHAILTGPGGTPGNASPRIAHFDGLQAVPGAEGCDLDLYHVSPQATALAYSLDKFPSLSQCRLPMFTFPDEDRRWLQHKLPGIAFKKYAPPY